jgi:hypothetical protein
MSRPGNVGERGIAMRKNEYLEYLSVNGIAV